MRRSILFIVGAIISFSVFAQTNAEIANEKIGRGINLGNALEAPSEGAWGVTLQASYFSEIAEAGFNSVRIPIRWSAHTNTSAPYTIDSEFINRVKWAIDQAFENNLTAIINIHHYDEIFQDPAAEHDKFIAIWQQISELFEDYSDNLIFEILNEPNTNLTAELWNTYLADALAEIRKLNPTRVVMIGSAEWGGVPALSKLKFPEGEQENVILTVHYYEPFTFTHQGASWVEEANAWKGTTWDSTAAQVKAINDHFAIIKQKAEELNVPVNIGEFGAINQADINSRVRWASHCARMFEDMGFSWNYWAFTANFDAYNMSKGEWIPEMKKALVGPFDEPQTDTTSHSTAINIVDYTIDITKEMNRINISTDDNQVKEVRIINSLGILVYSGQCINNLSISIDELKISGMYWVIVRDTDAILATYSFVK